MVSERSQLLIQFKFGAKLLPVLDANPRVWPSSEGPDFIDVLTPQTVEFLTPRISILMRELEDLRGVDRPIFFSHKHNLAVHGHPDRDLIQTGSRSPRIMLSSYTLTTILDIRFRKPWML